MLSPEIRFATPDDRPAVEGLSRTMKEVHQFPGVWKRWGAWESKNYVPIVAAVGGQVVGFHAAVYTKVYVTSYYQGVADGQRGRGIGGLMLDRALVEAHRLGCSRLKFKVAKWATQAREFWAGFGIVPAGEDATYFVYDLGIPGVASVGDLRAVGSVPFDLSATPKLMRTLYAKSKVVWYAPPHREGEEGVDD